MSAFRATTAYEEVVTVAIVFVLWWICLTVDSSVWLAAGFAIYNVKNYGIRFYLFATLATGIGALAAGIDARGALALALALACTILFVRMPRKLISPLGSSQNIPVQIANDILIPASIFCVVYATFAWDWTTFQTLPAISSGLMMISPIQAYKQINWYPMGIAGLSSFAFLILADATGTTSLTILIGSFVLAFLALHKMPDVWAAALLGTAGGLSLLNLSGEWKTDTMILIASISILLTGAHAQENRNQLAEAEDRIKRRNNRMRYLLTERDEVTALAVHDLQSPIQAIGGLQKTLLHMLNTGTHDPANMRNALTVAISTSHDLSDRIGSILSSKRPHLGGHSELSNLLELVNEVVSLHRLRVIESGVEIEISVPDTPITDAEEIKDILDVLLDNAITYTDCGGTISFSAVINESQQTLKLSLTDTGPGVSADTIDQILGQSSSVEIHGQRQGIGLYLAHRRIRKLAGNLRISSPENGGACFEITLPLTVRNSTD